VQEKFYLDGDFRCPYCNWFFADASGHLEIFSQILGLKLSGADSLQFDLVLHVATVLSTVVVLWHRFVPLCTSFFTLRRDENTRYVWKILLSCIPVGIVGLCFKEEISSFFGVSENGGNNLLTVGICLCVTALLLAFAHFFRNREFSANARSGRNISWVDAFVIGIGQAIAVLPGLSRSGTTIATGIILGDKREQVAQFSFFMVNTSVYFSVISHFLSVSYALNVCKRFKKCLRNVKNEYSNIFYLTQNACRSDILSCTTYSLMSSLLILLFCLSSEAVPFCFLHG